MNKPEKHRLQEAIKNLKQSQKVAPQERDTIQIVLNQALQQQKMLEEEFHKKNSESSKSKKKTKQSASPQTKEKDADDKRMTGFRVVEETHNMVVTNMRDFPEAIFHDNQKVSLVSGDFAKPRQSDKWDFGSDEEECPSDCVECLKGCEDSYEDEDLNAEVYPYDEALDQFTHFIEGNGKIEMLINSQEFFHNPNLQRVKSNN